MTLPRVVAAETLDALATDDPDAQRSRRDLRRIHRVMGTRGILVRALRAGLVRDGGRAGPLRVLELGAGDGTLMLGVAGALGRRWPAVELTLLDRQPAVAATTLEAYAQRGWRARVRAADVLDWAADTRTAGPDDETGHDLVIANLFLHHFEPPALTRLLAAAAQRTQAFLACEPRRSGLALLGSHLVGALGANAVTREDAVLSVHAGFRDRELSALWPTGDAGWRLEERAAGLFSHLFCAARTVAGADPVKPR